MRKRLRELIPIVLILIGCIVISYPYIASSVNDRLLQQEIDSYHKSEESISTSQYEEEKQKVKEYDDNLMGDPLHDPFDKGAGFVIDGNYENVLNVNHDGIMATIRIPKIDVNLPIYHTVDDDVLQKGVGHIPYTSTPYGGTKRHCFLAAHRGLPNALLFTDLNLLQEGDAIFIDVLNETHGYKVSEIQVINPEDFVPTRADDGEDLLTLVTCTPYGINTQRLLVTSTRDDTLVQSVKTEPTQHVPQKSMRNIYFYLMLVGVGIVLLLPVYLYMTKRKN